MSPTPPRPWLLALSVTVLAAALVYLWTVTFGEAPDDGVEVEVYVTRPDGTPVRGARARSRRTPAWQTADDQGRIHLHGVRPMREAVNASSVAEALEAEAPWHAPRRRKGVTVARGEDGRWQVHFVLEPYGLLRVYVEERHLPDARAWVVPDPVLQRIAPEGALAVARPGQPAAWRAFPDAPPMEVRLEGLTGVAARRLLLEAPTTGYVRELRLEPEAAAPIEGRFVAAAAERPPDLAGRLEVWELPGVDAAPDAQPVRQAYDVEVGADGSFKIPFAGPRRYRLVPHLDFADADALDASGGDDLGTLPCRARPWLVVSAAVPGLVTRTAAWHVERRDEGLEAWEGTWTRVLEDRVLIALPSPGHYRVRAEIAGDADHVPLAGRAEVTAARAGGQTIELELVPGPAGQVRLLLDEAIARAGATVWLLEPGPERTTTILPGFGHKLTLSHVPAGDVRLRVLGRSETPTLVFVGGSLEADGDLPLPVRPRGRAEIVLRGEGASVWQDMRDRLVRWGRGVDASPYGVAGELVLRRVPGTDRWEAREGLWPGDYELEMGVRGDPDAWLAVSARLELGETLELALPVP